jgi:hypothetical protein
MRRILRVVMVLAAVTGAGVLVFVLTRPPPKPDQRIAAEFLGVAPWRLKPFATEVTEYEWGRVQERDWSLPRCLGIVDWFSAAASVEVDMDRDIVTTCFWHPLTEKASWWPPALKPLGEEACVARGEEFLADRCTLFSSADDLVRSQGRERYGKPWFWLEWMGQGPQPLIHVISLELSALNGRPSFYSVRLGAVPPAELAEVRISPEQARQTVLDSLPDNLFDIKSEVSMPSYRSAWAPVGQPVYAVDVDAKIHLKGGPQEVYARLSGYAVHASTGELLTKTYKWPKIVDGQ